MALVGAAPGTTSMSRGCAEPPCPLLDASLWSDGPIHHSLLAALGKQALYLAQAAQ